MSAESDLERGGAEEVAEFYEAPEGIQEAGLAPPSEEGVQSVGEPELASAPAKSPRSSGVVSPIPRVAEDLTHAVHRTLSQSNHPIAAMFHLIPKLAAILVYLMGSIFSEHFIVVFIVLVLVLCFDFWVVKNITGRLLVGLRWWNEVDEDGVSRWIFESPQSAVDSRAFWFGLYLNFVIWVAFLVISVLKINIQWMMAVMIALVLNGTNIYCYLKCEKDARSQISSVGSFVASAFARRMVAR